MCAMANVFPYLFRPLNVGALTLRNRIVSAPNMMCALNPDGSPTDYMIGYFEEKAKGGAAQDSVGDTHVEERGFTTPRHPILDAGTVQKWSEVARAIRQHGAVASIELNHGGRIANTSVTGYQSIGPVDEIKANGTKVAAATEDILEEIAQAFAFTARLAKQAGFDMVMLHGAHGWFLDQMLSPKWNRRNDTYGGDLQGRARFPLMVIDKVRAAVGRDFPIEYRVGPELIDGGLTIEEVVDFCQMIEDKVDLIHVSAGLDTNPDFAVKTHPTIFLPHMPNVRYAEAVKQKVRKCPVIAVGSITTPEEAEWVLAQGKADAVAMTRSLIADPYLPRKARTGDAAEIRPCLRCLDCLTGMQTMTRFACAVNPRTGHEFRLDCTEKKPKRLKTVLVAGGGPGGMEAAATAAGQGHRVILAERSDSLGGLLRFTDHDDLKSDLRRFKDHLIHRVTTSCAEIRLHTEVTPELVALLQPDVLILALGSTPVMPPIPGLSRAKHATDIYGIIDTVGKTVTVMGGGLVGCETALFLAESGRDVTLIEMQQEIAPDANWMHKIGMRQAMEAKTNLTIRTGLRCTSVKDQWVEAVDSQGEMIKISAESVVYAFGQKSASVTELIGLDVPEIYAVGDCRKVGKTNGAIFDGYHVAMDL